MKRFLKSAWGISIGTAIFSFLLTIGYDILKNKPVLSTIWNILKAVWTFLITCLNFELKVWWVLLGIVAIIMVLCIIVKISDLRNPELDLPAFIKYTKGEIQGWHWLWHWEKQYDGKYDVENLHPICPKCETPLVSAYDFRGTIVCPRCNYNAGVELPDMNVVKMMIIDNVRKELFPREIDTQ